MSSNTRTSRTSLPTQRNTPRHARHARKKRLSVRERSLTASQARVGGGPPKPRGGAGVGGEENNVEEDGLQKDYGQRAERLVIGGTNNE
ncbi:2411_t:CDS:2 [Paraglomus occultum]|uniref:2411_t:CDS:1 n=1 Tax=Paraglomus occultum TaxID=144539 RepID=A0A9N9BGU4_9GLOM|nr:2411_t:CDS:2 [Paraglomus occultum]